MTSQAGSGFSGAGRKQGKRGAATGKQRATGYGLWGYGLRVKSVTGSSQKKRPREIFQGPCISSRKTKRDPAAAALTSRENKEESEVETDHGWYSHLIWIRTAEALSRPGGLAMYLWQAHWSSKQGSSNREA
jgi:hypothetical protein